jgi:hypothetical protein
MPQRLSPDMHPTPLPIVHPSEHRASSFRAVCLTSVPPSRRKRLARSVLYLPYETVHKDLSKWQKPLNIDKRCEEEPESPSVGTGLSLTDCSVETFFVLHLLRQLVPTTFFPYLPDGLSFALLLRIIPAEIVSGSNIVCWRRIRPQQNGFTPTFIRDPP